MGSLNFTGDLFSNGDEPRGEGRKSPFDFDEFEKATEEFITDTCNELAPPDSGKRCMVIDNVGTLVILVFEDSYDGNLLDGRVAINLFGTKWTLLPEQISDQLIEEYLQSVQEVMKVMDEIDDNLDEEEF